MIAICKAFLGFIIVLFLFYIIGSLCAADFNIKNWDAGPRIFCFSISGIFAIITAGLIYEEESN